MKRREIRRRRKALEKRQKAGEASEYLMVDQEGNVVIRPPNTLGTAQEFFYHPKIRSDLKKIERLVKENKIGGID